MNNKSTEAYDFTTSFKKTLALFDSLPESVKADFDRAMQRKVELEKRFVKHDLYEQEHR